MYVISTLSREKFQQIEIDLRYLNHKGMSSEKIHSGPYILDGDSSRDQ